MYAQNIYVCMRLQSLLYIFDILEEVNEVMIRSSWSGMLAALSLLLSAW